MPFAFPSESAFAFAGILNEESDGGNEMKFALAVLVCVSVANADDMGILRKISENKFESLPGLPSCTTAAVQSGDPSKGPSIILAKGKAGCI